MIERASAWGRAVLDRRTFLLALAATACTGGPEAPVVVGTEATGVVPPLPSPEPGGWIPQARAGLTQAAKTLWGLQTAEGGWPSSRYGLLKSGQSITPFVLRCLLDVPASDLPLPEENVGRALRYALDRVGKDGALGFASDPPDYPVYATALLVQCLARTKFDGWEALAAPSVAWLEGQQRISGFMDHPAHGGFPMGAREAVVPGQPGHIDLSMSRRALEALVDAGRRPEDPALQAALAFVLRSQRDDGSFVYSIVEDALNKGKRDEGGRALGYGSATTDGLIGLLAAGRTVGDPAFDRGLGWLKANHSVEENPGISGGAHAPFAKAMRYYYRAGAARIFATTSGPPGWNEALAKAILAEQLVDGSFMSDLALQKEDDPLVATAFAVQALAWAVRSATPGGAKP